MAHIVLFLRDTARMTNEVKDSLAKCGFVMRDYHETVHTVVGEIDDSRIDDIRTHDAVEWVEVRKAAAPTSAAL